MGEKRANRSAGRYLKNDKKNLKLPIIFLVLVLIVVAILIIHNLKTSKAVTTDVKKEVENAVNDTFTALKSANPENANKYIDYDSLIAGFDPILVETKSDTSNEIKRRLFQDIKWTVENIEINGDEAIVIVEVTNLNFKTIVTNWMKQIVSISSNGTVITNEIALDELKNMFSQYTETKTILKKVKLIKYENKWYIELNEDFRDLVFPGIDSVIAVLNQNAA